MTRPQRLSSAEIEQALASRPGWTRDGDRLRRTFEFPDFVAAFAFMTRVAFAAERLGHHPDWTNVYSRVDVALSTHDRGGITSLDLELAAAIDLAAA